MAQITVTPAPWRLTGSGWILAVRFSREAAHACLPAALHAAWRGGVGVLMWVDYDDSPVGPYRELLLVPGLMALGGRTRPMVSHIWVDSPASRVSGRSNWGIPKELADFTVEDGGQRWAARVGGELLAEAELEPGRLRLPARTGVLPRALRTLVQPWEGGLLSTSPRARGTVRSGHLRALRSPFLPREPAVLGVVQVERFRMTFPVATRRQGVGKTGVDGEST